MTPHEEKKHKNKLRKRSLRIRRIEEGLCGDCGLMNSNGRGTCDECIRRKQIEVVKWRNLTFTILGDKCTDCGTTDRRVFTIDHPDGDGKYHRNKKKHSWRQYYLAAQANNIFLEIRCYNCHAIKDLKREL